MVDLVPVDHDPFADDQVNWSRYNQSFGELKPSEYSPTQRIGNIFSDVLQAGGMQHFTANDLTSRLGNVINASPLGIAGSAMDTIAAKSRGDDSGVIQGMAGMIPGAGPEARAALKSGASLIKSGMTKSEIVSLEHLKNAIEANDGPLFVRWSQGPKLDMKPGAVSKDYQTGQLHNGLSALDLTSDMGDGQLVRFLRDYSYLRGEKNPGAAPHIYAGEVKGTDSDGAPSIRPTKYIGTLSKHMIAMLEDETVPVRLDLQQHIDRMRHAISESPDAMSPFTGRPMKESWQQQMEESQKKLSAMGGPVPKLVPVDHDPFK